MVEVLSQNNAIIDKFIGDAIVARFDSGDPATDALDAVRGAWGMCRELERFNLDSFEEVQSRIVQNTQEQTQVDELHDSHATHACAHTHSCAHI